MKKRMESYFDRLFPICRSITGEGLRNSFKILQELIPLQLQETPSGQKAFDWVVPEEWNIEDAYLITPSGRKICTFSDSNLHVVNYSVPINREMTFDELSPHLHFLKDSPDAIPYKTSYYNSDWGFCISYNEYLSLEKSGTYKAIIKSSLKKGSMTHGDLVLKGKSDREILISSYLCHPSLANNELSGPLTLAFLYEKIATIKDRRYTYRFVLAPETIGIINYLARHGMYMKEHVDAGFVLTCTGIDAPFTYKKSRRGDSLADRIAEHILSQHTSGYIMEPFDVGGSDERQYCSPGFDMPVGSLMRTPYKKYPEYHTSLDNKSCISFEALEGSVDMYFKMVLALEANQTYKSTQPFCEPNLGKRNLYSGNSGQILDMLFIVAHSDASKDLLKIASLRKKSILELSELVNKLVEHKLLVQSDDPSTQD